MTSPINERLGRFDHHPDPAIDFCCEVEALENIAANAKLGLSGFGHDEDREALDSRIASALDFRVGVDQNAIDAKAALRKLAASRGLIVTGEIAYAGQPIIRHAALSQASSGDKGRVEG